MAEFFAAVIAALVFIFVVVLPLVFFGILIVGAVLLLGAIILFIVQSIIKLLQKIF